MSRAPGVRDGGFVAIGQLSQQDLLAPYGSSAALDYHEYIKDPDSSKSSSSRLLTKRYVQSCFLLVFIFFIYLFYRIHNWLGTSFYVAPLSKDDVTGAIRIKAKFNVSLSWFEDIPQIVYWHAGSIAYISLLFSLSKVCNESIPIASSLRRSDSNRL